MARNADLKLNIKYAMDRVGMEPVEMAAALDVALSTYYWRMKEPEERLTIRDLHVIARKCSTTAAWLLGGTPAKR